MVSRSFAHHSLAGVHRHLAAERAAVEADLAAARAQERAAAEDRARAAQLAVNATPEALRRHRVSVVDNWLNTGRLDAEQWRAAQEICRVWEAITSGLGAKIAQLTRQSAGSNDGDWPAGLRRAYTERYIPWRAEAGGQMVANRVTVAELVLAVACDNLGPRQLATRYRLPRGRGKPVELVQASLYRYAECAGWLSGPRAGLVVVAGRAEAAGGRLILSS